MDEKIFHIYREILLHGRSPKQYLYQRLKGKVTGSPEFVISASDQSWLYDNKLVERRRIDEELIIFDDSYKPENLTHMMITLSRLPMSRMKLLKVTLTWCIKYCLWRLGWKSS